MSLMASRGRILCTLLIAAFGGGVVACYPGAAKGAALAQVEGGPTQVSQRPVLSNPGPSQSNPQSNQGLGKSHVGQARLTPGELGQAAYALERAGKSAEAEEAWRAFSRTYPSDPDPYAHLGLLEARQEHYNEAIGCYRKALALRPSMSGLRTNLALAYFKAGEYKDALLLLKPLLRAQTVGSDEAQRLTILIGMSHYGLGEFVAATPYLKQASIHDAHNLTLLLTMAHSCLLTKQYACVLESYHRIIALDADSTEAHVLAGEALDEMKDTQGAVREFRAAVAANPKEFNVHFGLGYLLWTQGQTEEAAREFQAELNNKPDHALAMLYLADSLIQLNREEEARPLLEASVKSNPENAMGHLDLGIIYTGDGRKEEALRELLAAAALKPEDVSAHYRLGRLYRAMGKTDEANAELAKSKTLNKMADEKLLKLFSRVPHGESTAPATAKP